MGSSNQELVVSLQTDGQPQKPALGFSSLIQIPDKIQNCLKVHFELFLKKDSGGGRGGDWCRAVGAEMLSGKVKESGWTSSSKLGRTILVGLMSLQKSGYLVTVPEGSLCNLNLRFKAGLPPDAIYNIIIDPENKRVFKNIKMCTDVILLVQNDQAQMAL